MAMSLEKKWESVDLLNQESSEAFRWFCNHRVARYYPWMTAELFGVYGELGLGPGFREYDGDGYPPRLPLAVHSMNRFCCSIDAMFPDYGFDKLLSSARSDSPDRISRMLAACSSLRLAQRNDTINLLYASVCSAYSHYSVGAARIYLSLWRERNQFLLSTVGLLWLMHYPLTRMKALAETARRKAYFRSALDIHVGQLSTGENPCYSSEEDNNEQIKVMEYLS